MAQGGGCGYHVTHFADAGRGGHTSASERGVDTLDLILEVPTLLGVELDIACKSYRVLACSIYGYFPMFSPWGEGGGNKGASHGIWGAWRVKGGERGRGEGERMDEWGDGWEIPFEERKSCKKERRNESMSRSRDQKDSSTMRRVRPSRGSRRRAVLTMAWCRKMR